MRLPGRQGKYTDVQTGKLLKRTPELVRFHAIATLHFSCIPVVLNWNYVRKEDSHASVNCPVIPSLWHLQTRQPVDYRHCHRVLDSSFSSQETLSPKSVSKPSSLLKRFKLALFRRAFSFVKENLILRLTFLFLFVALTSCQTRHPRSPERNRRDA